MTTKTSEQYELKILHDDYVFALELSDLVKYQEDTDEVRNVQAVVRSIIAKYGWNPSKYPEHSRYLFWSSITGDYWGQFKRLLKAQEVFDPKDESCTFYSC